MCGGFIVLLGAPLITSATITSRGGCSGTTISDDDLASFVLATVDSDEKYRSNPAKTCGCLREITGACLQARRRDIMEVDVTRVKTPIQCIRLRCLSLCSSEAIDFGLQLLITRRTYDRRHTVGDNVPAPNSESQGFVLKLKGKYKGAKFCRNKSTPVILSST